VTMPYLGKNKPVFVPNIQIHFCTLMEFLKLWRWSLHNYLPSLKS